MKQPDYQYRPEHMYPSAPYGFSYGFSCPPSPQDKERRELRGKANYIGGILLGLAAATRFMFTIISLVFLLFGVFSFSQLSQDMLGLGETKFLLLYAMVYTLSMLLPAVLISLCCGKRHFPLSPATRVNAADAFWGLLTAMGVCMVANYVAGYILSFLNALGVPQPEFPEYLSPNITSLLLNLLVFAILPALLEETVFRGYILRALRPHGDWFAVLISALLFGLMHCNVAQIPFAFIVGITLGWLYVTTDNIWLPVAVHFCNNALSTVLQYAGLDQSDDRAMILETIVILAILGVGLISAVVLLIRRSDLFRKLAPKSTLTVGQRIGALLRAPALILALIAFIVLTIVEI